MINLRRDIKKFTDEGHYNVVISLGMLCDKIKDWIDDLKLQLNPDFQRGHVWTEKQQTAFVEFILRGGKTTALQFNHPGWMGSFKGEFVCVDGLQRITALMKFVNNELPVFGGNYLDDFEDKDVLLRGFDIPVRVNALKTRKEVLTWYLELNTGGTPHTDDEIDKVKELLKTA
jgi:hypothetical protein